jgi:hypothetical protein
VKRSSRAVVAAALIALAIGVAGCAQEEKLTFTSQITSIERVLYQVGPETEHTYGWNRFTGQTSVAGLPAEVEMLGNVDYKSGDGPFFGFITLTIADGSQLAMRMDGKAILNETTNDTRFESPLEVIGGTGRWAKVTGKGEFTGNRRGALGSEVELSVGVTIKE